MVYIRFITQDEDTGISTHSGREGECQIWLGGLVSRPSKRLDAWLEEKRRGNGRIAEGGSNSTWSVLQQPVAVSNYCTPCAAPSSCSELYARPSVTQISTCFPGTGLSLVLKNIKRAGTSFTQRYLPFWSLLITMPYDRIQHRPSSPA